MKSLANLFYISMLAVAAASCSGQDNKNTPTPDIGNRRSKTIPDFLDRKYFKQYQLSADNDYPMYSYRDNKIGEFTVMYLAKDSQTQKEWLNYDSENNVIIEAEATGEQSSQINLLIKKKLEPNLDRYEIIAEYILPKYLVKNSYDYIYPYKKSYYLYDKKNKTWEFIKEKIVDDSSNEKNITKLNELNEMLNFNKASPSEKKPSKGIIKVQVPLEKIDGTWSSNCDSENHIYFSPGINNAQFTIENRFSMNAQLKKSEINKYEFYFTDFPPIIPLPDEMQIWDNMDNTKPVGFFEILNDSEIKLTWLGFYYKKTKKYIQTENPFGHSAGAANLIKCTDK